MARCRSGSADQPLAYFFVARTDDSHFKFLSLRVFSSRLFNPSSLHCSDSLSACVSHCRSFPRFLRHVAITSRIRWHVRKNRRTTSLRIRGWCVALIWNVSCARELQYIFTFFSTYERRDAVMRTCPSRIYARGWIFNSDCTLLHDFWHTAVIYAML